MRPDDRSREDRERHDTIASEILNSLPPRETDVVVRYFLDGQTETEIQQATGVTPTEQQQLRRKVRMEFFATLHSRGASGDAQ